jgi:hypothetical protein
MLIDHRGVIRFENIRQGLDEEIETLVKEAESEGMTGEKIAPEMRTFRDKTGKHRIKAIAEAGDGEFVVLRKEDGSTIKIALADLSKADQTYLATVELKPLGDAGDGATDDAADPDAESTAVADQPMRTFRDSSGKFDVEARLVEISGDEVVLEKEDGSRITVPIERLDDESRNYIDSVKDN